MTCMYPSVSLEDWFQDGCAETDSNPRIFKPLLEWGVLYAFAYNLHTSSLPRELQVISRLLIIPYTM